MPETTLIALAILFCLGLIPIHIRIGARYEDEWFCHLKIRWFFGFLPFSYEFREKETEEPQHKISIRSLFQFWNKNDDDSWIFLKRLMRLIRMRLGSLRLNFGTGDPAETGIILGWLWAIKGTLAGAINPDKIELNADFNQEICELRADALCKITPIITLFELTPILCSPAFWRCAQNTSKGAIENE